MKKKLFTLLTLLLCLCSGAWADDTYEYTHTPSLNTDNYFTASKGSSNAGTFDVNIDVTLANSGISTVTKAVKMEDGTSISFTSTRMANVYVGIYDRNGTSKNASNNQFKLDGTIYTATNSTSAGSYEIVTISNVEAGEHTITRNSKEVEIYYVKVVEQGTNTNLLLSVTGATSRSMVMEHESAIEVKATNASGSETYQWYRTNSSDTECVSGTAITGKTTTSFTPDEEEEGTYYYYCVVTDGDKTAKTSLITVAITAPRTGWVVFDGIVDTGLRATTVTYNNVSMTYATSASGVIDVSGKTNNTGRPYRKGIEVAKSTNSGGGGYLSFTIPTGYKATSFTWAFSGTGGRTIILASEKINSTNADGYIATLTSSVSGSNIVGGTYSTELNEGTYYIRECNAGGWHIDELTFTLAEANDPPATITFDPSTGSSVEGGSKVTLSSMGATTIMYQWGSSTVDGGGNWSSAKIYSGENKPEVPAYGSANNVLSVKASNTHGDTYGSATYTITAPTYTITYAAGGGSGTMTATTGITSGSDQTTSTNTFTRECYTFANWTANVDVTIGGETVNAGDPITDGATIQNVTDNITLTAQWTPVYASGTYVFDSNATVGTNPSKTVTVEATSYDAFQVDNLFFSSMKIQLETGTDGDGDNYQGWKIKSDGTIKFYVNGDKYITIGLGSFGSNSNAKITYTNLDGDVVNNASLSAATNNTFTVKSGSQVTISMDPDESNNKSVTLKKIYIEEIPTVSVSVGAKGYATYCNSSYALNFEGKSIKAYIAANANGNEITFTQVNKIAKGEPVLLYSETNSDSQSIPVTGTNEVSKLGNTENYFRAGDGTTAYEWADEDGKRIYVLNTTTKSPGFYKANKNKVATTRAYLSMPSGALARFSGLVFDGETTGISNLNVDDNLDADAPMYNLAGQRVNKSYKGVIIQNGKKMLNK